MTNPVPLTNAQRVKRAHATLIERGGKRLADIWLQPDAAQALVDLKAAEYGATSAAIVSTALLDAQKKVMRKAKA